VLRIAVHDYSGHPFQVQLSRELARRGHRVLHLHCPSYRTGKGQVHRLADDPVTFDVDGVLLRDGFDKYSAWKRLRQEREYPIRLLERLVPFRPDVVVSSNTPLFSQNRFLPGVRRAGVPFVFWQQDIYSLAMSRVAEAKVPLGGRLLGRSFQAMERRLLLASDAVVAIADDFRPVLRDWGVPDARLHVIENWAPLDELPALPRDNAWAREHGLVDKRVVLYSGTLGLKHDPGLLLALARAAADQPDVRVVVISEGLGAEWLRERAGGVDSLLLLPFQPYERLPEVHASADVLAVILEADAGRFSVPSKVWTYHCARRPILAALPRENLAARLIESRASGIVVEPGDEDAFVAAADALLDDPELRSRLGSAARAYAEEAFDIQRVGDRFEAVLVQVAEQEGGS
jgi:glycosyltransferase involved in cell wall biosynthesis